MCLLTFPVPVQTGRYGQPLNSPSLTHYAQCVKPFKATDWAKLPKKSHALFSHLARAMAHLTHLVFFLREKKKHGRDNEGYNDTGPGVKHSELLRIAGYNVCLVCGFVVE